MTTATYEGPSAPELQLLLSAAARFGTPAEHGREQARRTRGSLVRGLAVVAGTLALYDASLLVGAV